MRRHFGCIRRLWVRGDLQRHANVHCVAPPRGLVNDRQGSIDWLRCCPQSKPQERSRPLRAVVLQGEVAVADQTADLVLAEPHRQAPLYGRSPCPFIGGAISGVAGI